MSGALDHIAPDDTSFHAFCEAKEAQYDLMPPWWWQPSAKELVYRKWKAWKEAEIADRRATATAVASGKRVFKALDKAGD